MFLFAIGCFAVIALVYYTQLFIRQVWMLKAFTGPLALPIVGNIYSAEAAIFLKYLASCRKRFGNVFVYFAFTKPYLVVTEPSIARRVMSDSKTFPKGDDYSHKFSVAFGKGLVTSDGEKHKHDRATFGKYFIRSSVAKYLDLINSLCVGAMAEHLHENVSQNMEHFFAALALRVFMNFCVGTDFSSNHKLESEFCRTVSAASCDVGTVIVLNLPIFSMNPYVIRIKKFVEYTWGVLKPIVEQRKLDMQEGKSFDDPLDAMLKENLSEQDMKEHMVTMICAGHDTTAFFASYCIYLLGQHPNCQDLLRAEINEVLGDRVTVTADDLTEFKYMHNVMQEVLRLFAVIPIITRVATEDVFIKEANVTIPKGANVMIPMFLMNRDPEIWDRQNEFVPERFDGKGDYTSAKNGFFPFGYGSRTCIGNTLAQMEVAVFLCHILRKYRIESDPKFKLQIAAGISLTTSNGVKVVLKPLNK